MGQITGSPTELQAYAEASRAAVGAVSTWGYSTAARAYTSEPNDLGGVDVGGEAGSIFDVKQELVALADLVDGLGRALAAADGSGVRLVVTTQEDDAFAAAMLAALADENLVGQDLIDESTLVLDSDMFREFVAANGRTVFDHGSTVSGLYGAADATATLGTVGRLAYLWSEQAEIRSIIRSTGGAGQFGRSMNIGRTMSLADAWRESRAAMHATNAVLDGGPGRIATTVARVPGVTATGAQTLGRRLGWAGVGYSAIDGVVALNEGEHVDAGVSFAQAGAGATLLLASNPVTLGVAGVVVVGTVIYQNREAIADFASDAAGAVTNFVKDPWPW